MDELLPNLLINPYSDAYGRIEPGAKARGTHLAHLDGIRALAVLCIASSHWWTFQYGALQGWMGALTGWMLTNQIAVDAFVVLSGFCLMMPVSRSGGLSGGALEFYWRRALRILPPFFAALIVAAASWIAVDYLKHHSFSTITLKMFMTSALHLRVWTPSSNSLTAPLWTIAAAWSIYVLFPLLIVIWQKFGIARMLASGALFALALTLLLHAILPGYHPDVTWPWYVFLFTLGAAAAANVFSPKPVAPIRWPWVFGVSLVSLVALLVRYRATRLPDLGYFAHLPAIDIACGIVFASFFAILTGESMFAKVSRRALAARPLVAIGTCAYSLYLFHMPILMMVQDTVNRLSAQSSAAFRETMVGAVGLPATLVGCYIFFLLFERPFLIHRAHEPASEMVRDAVLAPAP